METDLELLIPESYVGSISERLGLYTQLDEFRTKDELEKFEKNLADRFGPLPVQVKRLMKSVELRWIGVSLGMEKLILKDGSMRGYFISKQEAAFYQGETFGQILEYVNNNPGLCVLKEVGQKLMLKFEKVTSVEKAIEMLSGISIRP
jgi:transcription-repair coupling factor (superfamily II helicase)